MSRDLVDDEDLWGRFLGKKYNRMSKQERTLPNLVDEFYHRRDRDRIIDKEYGSKEEFLKVVESYDDDTARGILLTIWAKGEWQRRSRGEKFEVNSNFTAEIECVGGKDDYDISKLRDGTALVWVTKSVRRDLVQSDNVRNRTQREAQPLFVRFKDGVVEARGARRRLNKFVTAFNESDQVTRIRPELTDESIIDSLDSIFTTDLSTLRLIDISFRSSSLPNGSGIQLSNPDGVQPDLNSSEIKQSIIGTQTLSELESVKFEHESSGSPVELTVERTTNGFYFDIRDSNLTEPEKENVELVLKDKIGVSLDTIYRYDLQHHSRDIIHQILTGEYNAYQEYYDDIDDEEAKFVNQFINVIGTNKFQCFRCNDVCEIDEPSESEHCPKCGNQLFRGDQSVEVDVDEEAVLKSVQKRMEEIPRDISSPDGTRLLDIETNLHPPSNAKYLRTTFQLTESVGSVIDSHRYEYFIYPMGNGRMSSQINRYLKDCVLITYGQSFLRGYSDFGTIGLHEFLTCESPGEKLASAIFESRQNLEERVSEHSNNARERLANLQEKVQNGTITDASREKRQDLKEWFDHDDFERDVFYLLKSMFLFTERWGRIGEAESDGCLVIPTSKTTYYVASYDPKLTYDPQGYDLDSEEKSKAAYYILTENNDEYISEVLKDGDTIDGHIFISDIFRTGQFEHVADRVQEWFSLVEGRDDEIDVPIVFLDLHSLLKLYDIVATRFDLLREYPELQSVFRSEFISQLTDVEGGFVHFNEQHIDSIRKKIIQKASQISKKDSIK
ncbi:hypothetical protein [Halomontanus rarus]|uniref:hypothetical protein n=1 Tax=Halomontanus rarus TaxID=3034020 RepID=UPI00307C217C